MEEGAQGADDEGAPGCLLTGKGLTVALRSGLLRGHMKAGAWVSWAGDGSRLSPRRLMRGGPAQGSLSALTWLLSQRLWAASRPP